MGTILHALAASSDSDDNPWFLIVFVGVLGGVGLFNGIRFWRRRWAIVDTPTSNCVAVHVGHNEVVGFGQLPDPLTAPVTQQPAVWFRWILEKWVRRGKSSRWETVEEVRSSTPFWLRDETGEVLVRPEDAEVHAPQVFRRRAHKSGVTHMHHDGRPVADLGRRYRITEWRIDPDQRLYVLGSACQRDDAVALQFVDGGGDDRLLVSTHSEARMARASLGLAILGLAMGWAAAGLLPATVHSTFSWRSTGPEPGSPSTLDAVGIWMASAVVLYGVGLVLVYCLRVYNRLVAVKHQAANAWSLIEIALERRHQLLPQLVTVAKAYAEHERELLESIAQARADALLPHHEELPTDESLRRADELNQHERDTSRSLLALAESYPDLGADEVFQDLARRLIETEDQVASSRAFYNDAVTVLRDRRRAFPGLLLAGLVTVPSWRLFDAGEPAVARPPTMSTSW